MFSEGLMICTIDRSGERDGGVRTDFLATALKHWEFRVVTQRWLGHRTTYPVSSNLKDGVKVVWELRDWSFVAIVFGHFSKFLHFLKQNLATFH